MTRTNKLQAYKTSWLWR